MDRHPSPRALLDFATHAAWQAGRRTLAWFQTGVEVEWKPDGSPVTAADRASETTLRTLIERRFPDHSILGEELGESDRRSAYRWVLDPIDGTRSFVHGVPLYGVLVGLEIDGEPTVGVAYFPALDEIVAAAVGEGCWWNGRPARVSNVSRLEAASVGLSDPRDLARLVPEAWQRLQDATRVQRGWGDCYGHCLVATGRLDLMLDPVMNHWDSAALAPLVREAGGSFTDWTGQPTVTGGHAVSTNGPLFEPLMSLLRTAPTPSPRSPGRSP